MLPTSPDCFVTFSRRRERARRGRGHPRHPLDPPPGPPRHPPGSIDIVIGTPIARNGSDWRAGVKLRDTARDHVLRHCGEPDLA